MDLGYNHFLVTEHRSSKFLDFNSTLRDKADYSSFLYMTRSNTCAHRIAANCGSHCAEMSLVQF